MRDICSLFEKISMFTIVYNLIFSEFNYNIWEYTDCAK